MVIYGLLIFCDILFLFIGRFIFFYPGQTIELQKKFYEKINWKMEPISMKKELRNTKIMGLFILIITFAGIFYSFITIMEI